MSTSLTFSRILNPVCSCGNRVGRLQREIEMKLFQIRQEESRETDDSDLSNILTDMGITKMCCRSTIIISPILPIMSTTPQFNIYQDTRTISIPMERITIGNPNPDI